MKSDLYNQITGIKFCTGWQEAWIPSFANTNVPKTARPWQLNAIKKIFDQCLSGVYAPPATGKGVLICILAHLLLQKYPNMRVVIVAPQKNITKDLKTQTFIHPHIGEVVYWKPSLYLNDTSKNTQSNLAAFIAWANKPISECEGVNDRVCIMTHQSLCRIFNNGEKKLFKDMALFVDEYHHVFLSSEVPCNKLGEVVKYFIDNRSELNLHICLTTATPFRGDRLAPIPKEEMKNFVEYSHPMDEAMPDFSPLQWFGLDFILYKKTWRQAINHLLGDGPIKKSIFYTPNVNSAYSMVGGKNNDVKEIYRAIAGCKTPKIKIDGAFTLVWRNKENKWIRCIDLVDDTTNREVKHKIIFDDHDADVSNIDVIIALDMLVEGSNWRWCVNEYIIGNHNSLREFIQMYGRLFRSCPEKTHVHCYYLLAHSSEYDTSEYLENFNDYLKAVFATLILVNVLQPQLVSTLESNGNGGWTRINYLSNTFSATEYQSYIEKAQDAMTTASIKNNIDVIWKKDDMDGSKTIITHEELDILKSSLDQILQDMGVTENLSQIKNETIRLFRIASIVPMMDLKGLDVSKINYDMIEASNVHPLTCMVIFGSGMKDINTLKELRMITDALFADFDEVVSALKEFKTKHGHMEI